MPLPRTRTALGHDSDCCHLVDIYSLRALPDWLGGAMRESSRPPTRSDINQPRPWKSQRSGTWHEEWKSTFFQSPRWCKQGPKAKHESRVLSLNKTEFDIRASKDRVQRAVFSTVRKSRCTRQCYAYMCPSFATDHVRFTWSRISPHCEFGMLIKSRIGVAPRSISLPSPRGASNRFENGQRVQLDHAPFQTNFLLCL